MRHGGPENGREGHSEPRNDKAEKSASKRSATITTMREAWEQAKDAKELPAQLAARNIRLARVTADDAHASEQRRPVAKQRGRYSGPLLKEGEIVAVDQWGRVYRFDNRTTGGAAAKAVRERLAGVDAATLDTVTAAKDAIKAASRGAWIEEQAKGDAGRAPSWIEKRILDCKRQARLAGVVWKRSVKTGWGQRIF
jgi:hypothetical protein